VRAAVLGIALWASSCSHLFPTPPELPVDFFEEGKAGYQQPNSPTRGDMAARAWDPGMSNAQHRSLPLGACVLVTNLENGTEARVHINERGAYTPGIILDVSYTVARRLGMLQNRNGQARVRLTPCKK
jgi:rare lipoprotein A